MKSSEIIRHLKENYTPLDSSYLHGQSIRLIKIAEETGLDINSPTILDDLTSLRRSNKDIQFFLDHLPGNPIAARERIGYMVMGILSAEKKIKMERQSGAETS